MLWPRSGDCCVHASSPWILREALVPYLSFFPLCGPSPSNNLPWRSKTHPSTLQVFLISTESNLIRTFGITITPVLSSPQKLLDISWHLEETWQSFWLWNLFLEVEYWLISIVFFFLNSKTPQRWFISYSVDWFHKVLKNIIDALNSVLKSILHEHILYKSGQWNKLQYLAPAVYSRWCPFPFSLVRNSHVGKKKHVSMM